MSENFFNPKEFLIELCKYYMEFLETDFKDYRPPSRRVSIYTGDRILIDIELAKYPKLTQYSLSLLSNNFLNNPFTNIGKEDFAIKFPKDIIKKIRDIQNNPSLFSTPEQIIIDFLKRQNFSNREAVTKDIQDKIKESEGKGLASYLSHYVITSFYNELYDLWKNKQVLDKQDFYLYFLDIRYDHVYPIFYIPVSIERTDEGNFSFEFDPVLLINKKAIEYVSRKFADEKNKDRQIDLPPRHLYLSNFKGKDGLLKYIQSILNEICDFFGLKPFQINSFETEERKNDKVILTNSCYLSLFDKSDEALLNDYEELLTLALAGEKAEALALDIFEKLSTDYLFENPLPFQEVVQQEYNNQSVGEKLAYTSPIPLNKEQLQVLRAINKKGCNRIIIEGPPGTGKSHTITAIIYEALLNNKSVLMVSDKKEALDIVEEKINDVLDKMKLDDFIQNPIVRLGKKESTLEGIFKQNNFDKIKDRSNAYKRLKDQVEKEIESISIDINRNIINEIEILSSLNSAAVSHLFTYEEVFDTLWRDLIDLDELEDVDGSLLSLLELWKASNQLYSNYNYLFQKYKINFIASSSISEFKSMAVSLNKDIKNLYQKIVDQYPSLALAKEMSEENLIFLEDCLKKSEELKKPVIGYLFAGKKLKLLESRFKERFFFSGVGPIRRNKDKFSEELQLYKHCQRLNQRWINIGLDLFLVLKEKGCEDISKILEQLVERIDTILSVNEKLPITCNKFEINISDINTVFSNGLIKRSEEDISKLKEYLDTYFVVRAGSAKLSHDNFMENRKTLENRLVFKMANILDESVVNFREKNKNDAEDLRKIVRAKKKIPKNLLKKLVEAFPCLIVGIRELGEFIPLEPDIFDILIIDEASQVSIAQAFPAILRSKKVVVLGDEKQYSNVKSHNASGDVNKFLFNRVRDGFKKSIMSLGEDEKQRINDKVEFFNIKSSILDFLRNITNYQCSLKKHFRGYIEIIGYSNETFYQDSLQVMKIRAKSITDVIQFYYVQSDEKEEKYKNTNQAEVDFILSELNRLKSEGFKGTVGIITPFTNQQKLISNRVYDSENWQFYQKEFKLKIMTFDSCQGDEKDIIYYSMVEKPEEDILKHVFPIKLPDKKMDGGDDNLKAQRLNVGFSRAKESIRFVMSKKPEEIRGEIGKALQFYKGNLEKPDNAELLKRTDPKSPMEPVLLNLIRQTPFYKENSERIEIVPQFDIGRYIKQLNPWVQIPKYRTDFLLIYKDHSNKTNTVILEYDGFEHFKDTGFVNETNFDRFYIEEDIERQKTIESYGYAFIRVNRFLLRDEPVMLLNDSLERHFKKKP